VVIFSYFINKHTYFIFRKEKSEEEKSEDGNIHVVESHNMQLL